MAITVSVIGLKGGTGKSTVAINLAAGLAKLGFKTLLIDADFQASATMGLGVEVVDGELTILDVMKRTDINDCIRETLIEGLWLLPADISLSEAEMELTIRPMREIVLRTALEKLDKSFQYVIIDSRPALDLLVQNALMAADHLIYPITSDPFALKAFGYYLQLIDYVTDLKRKYLHKPSYKFDCRILLNMHQQSSRVRDRRTEQVLKPLRKQILQTKIRRTESVGRSHFEEGDSSAMPVIARPRGAYERGAAEYRALVKEIVQLWQN
ncbi:MAG: ParA family protein [Acidobacteria bacterium]|nr:ParA family protein [Acidobacteriota bacterium]